ncbi:multidrug effflux MFS transporter [Marinibaculum pumilum]|uniref:Bcr/CflA family efflux transporter n=2 Tax=Marinibaculum pumilum TaxID=1766165 RepID=A0ABV7KW66_9PROT
MGSAAGLLLPNIRTRRSRLLALLTALSTLGLLATNLYLPSLPGLAADLQVGAADIRLTLTVFLAGLAISQLVVGPLSDRYGRRPVLLAGLALYVATSIACALAASVEMLLLWRVLQAIGACTGVVLVRAVARDLFEGAALTRAMAVIATLMASAPGFSPLVGGLIETVWGWRGNFWFVAAFGTVCLLLTLRWIGETNRTPTASIAVGRVGRTYMSLLANPLFLGPALATGFALAALFAYFSASPQLIIDVLGFTPLGFGLLTAGTVFAVFAGGAAGPRIARRLGATGTLSLGMAMMAAGAAAMALLFQAGEITLAGFLAPQILFLAGLGIVNPVGTATALQPFPQVAGAASAMLGFLQMAGGTLGTLLLTALPGAFPLTLPLTMGILALAGLAALLLCRALAAPAPVAAGS